MSASVTLQKLRNAFQQEDFAAFDTIVSELEKLDVLNCIVLPKKWTGNLGCLPNTYPEGADPSEYVRILYRNFTSDSGSVNAFSWVHNGGDYDIMAYYLE